jgi:(heptosyl)LPS beta-1,4-glucosyltransferase
VTQSPVSAVIITLNEERNLPFCLRSLRPWVDEIVLVDMMSDDRTVEVARPFVDRILEHERIPDFDAARAVGVDAARNEWILSIDADELVTPELAGWIASFVAGEPPFEVARLPRVNIFLGRWIPSSNWWPGLPRLFRRDALTISGELHRGLRPVRGARIKLLPKDPQLSLWHFSNLSLEALTEKTNRYTTIEARQSIARGRPVPRPHQLFGRALRGFWTEYVRRRGYRDGMPGLVYALNQLFYRYLSVAKRWDERHRPARLERYDRMRERILAGFADGGGAAPPEDGPSAVAAGDVEAARLPR